MYDDVTKNNIENRKVANDIVITVMSENGIPLILQVEKQNGYKIVIQSRLLVKIYTNEYTKISIPFGGNYL